MKTYSINSPQLDKVYKEWHGVSPIMKIANTKELAECVGLWLAEGDQKSISELTFTNNNFDLITHFAKNIQTLYNGANQPRLYVYSNNSSHKLIKSFKKVRYYTDIRANRPYYIYRLADRKFLKDWHNLVPAFTNNKNFYAQILRGFFAGEGNIKESARSSRCIRIAQKSRKEFVDNILTHYGIKSRFSERERAYVISDRYSIEKLYKLGIANLHKGKLESLKKLVSHYKQYHYSKLSLKNSLCKQLITPFSSRALAKIFNRSQARIQRVLTQLKREGTVLSFRVHSNTFWIRRDRNIVLISDVKQNYLKFLKNKTLSTSEISKKIKVTKRSAQRRLQELLRLSLIKQNIDKRWELVHTNKKVKVICL